MKQMKKEVKSLTKELKALTQKTEKIVKTLEKLEKAQTKSKPKKAVKKPAVKKTAKKPTENKTPKRTVVGAVMGVIQSSKKGVSVAQIMEQTGLNKGQIWPAISRAKKEGKVKIVKKGIYVEV